MDKFSKMLARVTGAEVRDLIAAAQIPGMLSLGGGLPAASSFDLIGLRGATEQVLQNHAIAALQYGTTYGQDRLIRELQIVMELRGIATPAENVVVTAGSQQALDLICRVLINPGDRILVEKPTYVSALHVFQLCGAEIVQISDQLDIQNSDRVKLCYVVPNFANPTGMVMPTERRKELLRWAVQNQVLIVEDDPYGELYFDAPPPESLYSLAQKTPGADELVIYLSTVSKTIAPGLRVGWAVLPLELVEPVTRVKQAADIHTSALTQEIVATYLELGLQEDHLGAIRDHYREKCILLSKEIRKKLGHEIDINQPQGGLFLWGRLKRDFDSRELLAVAKGEGVIFMPGSAFGAGDDLKRYMRISFANIPNDKIPLAVDRLKLAIETMVRRQDVRSLSLEI